MTFKTHQEVFVLLDSIKSCKILKGEIVDMYRMRNGQFNYVVCTGQENIAVSKEMLFETKEAAIQHAFESIAQQPRPRFM